MMMHIWSVLIGIFLILLGSLLLLDRLGWIDIHIGQYILPIFLIALGGSMVFGGDRRRSERKRNRG